MSHNTDYLRVHVALPKTCSLRKYASSCRTTWRFSDADLAERTRWRDYQLAYGEALERCSTKYAPWYVIPADRKWYRDWAVSGIVSHTLQKLNPRLPEVKLNVPRLRARLLTS